MVQAQQKVVCGYDAKGYTVGDRVELHPGMGAYMQGACYGTVKHISTRGQCRVSTELDRIPGRIVRAHAD